MNPEEFDIHRRIDIARSRVIITAREIVRVWRVSGLVLTVSVDDCAKALDDLDKIQSEWKEPLNDPSEPSA